MQQILTYCRAGYESTLLGELAAHAAACGFGISAADAGSGTGFVTIAPGNDLLYEHLIASWPVFARQVLLANDRLAGLPKSDRVTPIVAAARGLGTAFSAIWIETTDTDSGHSLLALCRKLRAPMEQSLARTGLYQPDDHALPRLHVFLPDTAMAYLCAADPKRTAPWPMGIPRLRAPRAAPSRSVLKLEEAIVTFIPPGDRSRLLRPGMHAVDLGAAPGGWSWLLAENGIRVTAVDHGRLASTVLASGLVEHVRTDGFTYKPRRPADWMVCDMVDKPQRSAALIAKWIANRWCRNAIFNLKLPGHNPGTLLDRCRAVIVAALPDPHADLRFRHLYHDRAEVTGFYRAQ